MNYKKYIALLAMLMILSTGLYAQPAGKLAFTSLTHNFGKVSAESGTLTHTFYFKNIGSSSIRITRVMPSCKCTVPTWTSASIPSKGSGTIEVIFDPSEQIGAFTKHITVNTTGEPQAVLLKITGEVIRTTPVAIKKAKVVDIPSIYRKKSGNLRFNTNLLAFGDVIKEEKKEQHLTVFNTSSKPVTLNLSATILPKHLSLKASKEIVAPLDSVILTFIFDEMKKNDWGYVHSSFFLDTDDDDTSRKLIDVSARIIEDFSKIKKNTPVPVATLDKDQYDFGTLSQYATVSARFLLQNKGQSTLYIRKTKASCGCTASEPAKNILPPGASTPIEITFRSGANTGYQNKSITIITNDPKNPELVIWISANIVEEASGGK